MNNRDLIIKIARRLDKFSFEEMLIVSEIEENTVKNILSKLLEEKIILKNGKTYFYNPKSLSKPTKLNVQKTNSTSKQIIIEEEDGYEDFLQLSEYSQEKVRNYVNAYNFVSQNNWVNIRNVLDIYNLNSGCKRVSYATLMRIHSVYEKYGFKGVLPKVQRNMDSTIPEEIYNCFKKHYLNKNKLSFDNAIYQAQVELQKINKVEQPYAYSTSTFKRKILSEYPMEQIEHFRNTIPAPRNLDKKLSQEPTDMLFKDAARIYFQHLKLEKKLQKLMQEKTTYKNHLKEYFDSLTINEITPKTLNEFRQKEFEEGYNLNSVMNYIALLKTIIKNICPETNKLVRKNDERCKNAYAMNMTILDSLQIKKLLKLTKKKYSWAYPIVKLALSTGASVPEILALTWEKIDLEKKSFYTKYFLYGDKLISNRVGSTIRTLFFDDEIYNILKAKLNIENYSQNDLIFKNGKTKLLQKYFEEKVLTPLAIELGVEKLQPSDLVHNYVNLCITQNVPFTYIQKTVGSYGIVNLIKTYRDLIVKTEIDYYNPLKKIK